MAIITDATGRQLAQAVGGIDTGGLAKDTTLQATNTALGNINTTEQSIATAINSLGQLLGNDKANISGDNIADKVTFRNNIGLIESTTNLTSAISQVYKQYIKKFYNIVFCYIDINNLNTTSDTTIGYLPEGFRPYHNINHEIVVIGSLNASFKGYAHVYVKTTGEITYKSLGSYTATFSTINLVFPIN